MAKQYTLTFKAMVADHAIKHGNKTTAEAFCIPYRTVAEWSKRYREDIPISVVGRYGEQINLKTGEYIRKPKAANTEKQALEARIAELEREIKNVKYMLHKSVKTENF